MFLYHWWFLVCGVVWLPVFHSLWQWGAKTAVIDQCNMSNKWERFLFHKVYDHLWQSVAPSMQHFYEVQLWTWLCAVHSGMCSPLMVAGRLMCLSSLIRESAQHTFSTIVSILGYLGCCLSSAFVLPLSKAGHHIHDCFHHITPALYTSAYWQWISTGVIFFTCKYWITLTNIQVSSGPATSELIIWWYIMLMVPSLGCMMTKVIYICLLYGETHS